MFGTPKVPGTVLIHGQRQVPRRDVTFGLFMVRLPPVEVGWKDDSLERGLG